MRDREFVLIVCTAKKIGTPFEMYQDFFLRDYAVDFDRGVTSRIHQRTQDDNSSYEYPAARVLIIATSIVYYIFPSRMGVALAADHAFFLSLIFPAPTRTFFCGTSRSVSFRVFTLAQNTNFTFSHSRLLFFFLLLSPGYNFTISHPFFLLLCFCVFFFVVLAPPRPLLFFPLVILAPSSHILGIGTFKGPFTTSGNGYYAGWIAFAASLKYAYGSNEVVRGFADRAADAMKVWKPLGLPMKRYDVI